LELELFRGAVATLEKRGHSVLVVSAGGTSPEAASRIADAIQMRLSSDEAGHEV
jgi:phosphoserine phosphatase